MFLHQWPGSQPQRIQTTVFKVTNWSSGSGFHQVVWFKPDQGSYVVWIKLTVSSQTVQESLDVRSEDGVKSCIIYFIQMFSETVPEVKGDLHHLDQTRAETRIIIWRFQQPRNHNSNQKLKEIKTWIRIITHWKYNLMSLCYSWRCCGYFCTQAVVVLQSAVLWLFSYLVLRVSCTDQQQLQCPQVAHTLTWTPDCRF